MSLFVGIDIGSTTVKTVVLSDTGELLFRSYERHFSRVREKASEQLKCASSILKGQNIRIAITGSAGLGVAKSANIPFTQEVYATASAVNRYIPDTDAVIELGGEDAKIIFFSGGLEERMNGSCAGGTGAFIDQMATLMNVDAKQLDELSQNYEKIYPIASRCGVFAKSDIQPILNQGGRKEDVAASIFQAVVDQTVAGLTQGRELKGKIVFLGGPLYFLKGLRNRFIETLNLDDKHAIFPENADCYAALGAAICAEQNKEMSFEGALESIENSVSSTHLTDVMKPLFNTQEEYDEFCARHQKSAPKDIDSENYRGNAYLGIDAGSTTTKIVLISEDGGILYSYYASNRGDPVSIVLSELKNIYAKFSSKVKICGSGVTGYGEDLIKNAFSVDFGIVETMSHYRAARHFNPNVDFIIDIGGQDMKCFKIRSGAIDSILLNEACSSGCGSFIETFANALGYKISDFAKIGLFDKSPVNLGSRCTVFMNSSVKQAQKEGASVNSISAGLSISIVKNAIYKVIRAVSADDLGKNIVVQGGTFLNDAVLRGFEMEMGRDVTRPTIAGLMGAYGAALTAKDKNLKESNLLKSEALENFSHSSKPMTCNGCTNKCSITINVFDGSRKFISGNRCSRPLGKERSTEPNLMRFKYDKLRSMCGSGLGNGSMGKIGIPFVLNMYENLPFWFEFLTSLNFEVVLSDESNRPLYIKGQRTIPSDTVCYPAKLSHGHIESLVEKGLKTIFYPCMPYNFDEGKGDNHYNCPVVAYYPELLGANLQSLKHINYLTPYFALANENRFTKAAIDYFGKQFNIPAKYIKNASKRAYGAYYAYKNSVIEEGEKYIDYARSNNKQIIVLSGRPYHIDREINHGIDDLITSFGLVLITEDAISQNSPKVARTILNQWTYQSRMYSAADYVVKQPDMQMIQLVSFGCGTDAITTDELRSILERGGKLYTQLKIDDISNLGAVKIRIRSLIAAIEARKENS